MKLIRRIASRDYTEDMLPQSRKEVFADVWKLHWFELLMLGALLLLAYLPILINGITADAYEARLTAEYGGNAAELSYQVISFQITSAFLNIPFYGLFGLMLAGVLRVIRQYAWEEVVFFWRDLWTGIRQNWKQVLILALLAGLQNAIGIYLIGNGQISQNQGMRTGGTIFYGMFLLLFVPVFSYMLIQIAIYSNTFLQNLKLAFLLYAKNIGKTLLVLLGLCGVLLVSLLPPFLCHLLGQVFGILCLPIMLLVWFLYVSAQLDRFVNPIHFPELIGRGMNQTNTEIMEKEDLCS